MVEQVIPDAGKLVERDILRLDRSERVKAFCSYYVMRLMGWRPIETAPKDGTQILALEGYDDARASIMVARWYTPYFKHDDSPPDRHPFWWGLSWRTGYSDWDYAGPYGSPDQIAITPQWWKPWRKPGSRMALLRYWASWVCYDREACARAQASSDTAKSEGEV